MLDISLIMLGAGDSSRFKMPAKKQWLRIANEPLWLYASKNLAKMLPFKKIIIAAKENEIAYMKRFEPSFEYIIGGKTRQQSLKNALNFVDSEYVMTSDIARPCILPELISRLINQLNNAQCIVPALKVADTAILGSTSINRDELKLIQTPQISRLGLLKKALENNEDFTDDSQAISAIGAKICYVQGDEKARKITFKDDLGYLNLPKADKVFFSGNGFDVHSFCAGEYITLCGVKIPYIKALKAHSDGDAPLHALCDAIYGASGLGDIGEHFPDTNERYKDACSKDLLANCVKMVRNFGFDIVNADITILAQQPKITPFKEQMRQNVASILGVNENFVNIKATTMEKMGFIGREEGIGALASVSLKYYQWHKDI